MSVRGGAPTLLAPAALALAATLALAGCQPPPAPVSTGAPAPATVPASAPTRPPTAPPTPAATAPARPAASASPAAAGTAAPVPLGAGRVEVLQAANRAFDAGDLARAADLYARVVNTPPTAGESSTLAAAVAGFARFRAMLALVRLDREDDARRQLEALRADSAESPFARLADQFWNQYTATGDPRAACANLAPQVASQAGAPLGALRAAGVAVEPNALCR